MTKQHVQIAHAVRDLPIDELCALIEGSDLNRDIAVMERLVIGAAAAPILVRHIRATLKIVEAYGQRAKAAGAHEAEAAALGIARELREHRSPEEASE